MIENVKNRKQKCLSSFKTFHEQVVESKIDDETIHKITSLSFLELRGEFSYMNFLIFIMILLFRSFTKRWIDSNKSSTCICWFDLSCQFRSQLCHRLHCWVVWYGRKFGKKIWEIIRKTLFVWCSIQREVKFSCEFWGRLLDNGLPIKPELSCYF